MTEGPLHRLIKKEPKKHKPRESSVEVIVFSFIVVVFIMGLLLFATPQPTGRVIFEENTATLDVNQYYDSSDNVTLTLRGNVTSLRITGKFIGSGTGQIYVNDFLVIDSRSLQPSGNLITGNVVSDLTNNTNNSDEIVTANETLEENVTVNDTLEVITNETNLTEDILVNVTTNKTVNESLNLTYNITTNITVTENVTFNLTLNFTENATLNITQNATTNITQNLTENATSNITIADDKVESFSNYCEDSCYLNLPNEVTLKIVLDNASLNLTSVTYSYLEPVFEENITLNETVNITLNETLNLTNITGNISSNISTNLSLNLTNVTTNVSVNITTNVTINITENITANITTNATNITIVNVTRIISLETLNQTLLSKGMKLFDNRFVAGIYNLTIGVDRENYAIVSTENYTKVNINFIDSNDSRLNSKIFVLSNGTARLFMKTTNADTVLKCVQYTNECKKWQHTNIPFTIQNSTVSLDVGSGIYAMTDIETEQKEFIATNSVYYNSNCEKCVQASYCNFRGFCAMQNHVSGYDYEGQLDFDILNLDSSFNQAEICSYLYTGRANYSINYIKYTPESFCSDFRLGNTTSNLINYELVRGEGWTCIDATEIVKYAKSNDYSNVFVRWQGHDLGGGRFPISCYRGITNLSECGGYNPSGADDCRPFMRLDYSNG